MALKTNRTTWGIAHSFFYGNADRDHAMSCLNNHLQTNTGDNTASNACQQQPVSNVCNHSDNYDDKRWFTTYLSVSVKKNVSLLKNW